VGLEPPEHRPAGLQHPHNREVAGKVEEAPGASAVYPGLRHLEYQDPGFFLEEPPRSSRSVGVPDRPGVPGNQGGRVGDDESLSLRGGDAFSRHHRRDEHPGGEDSGQAGLFRPHG